MSEWGAEVPAYLRVAADLRRRIESGELAPGAKIPSVTAMASGYKVAGTTAQKAVRALKAAGFVTSQPGKGVFVRDRPRTRVKSADYVSPMPDGDRVPHLKSTQIAVEEVVPPDEIAEILGLDLGEPAVQRSRVMAMRDEVAQPVELVASYFPLDVARGTELARVGPIKGAVPSALRRLGLPPRSASETVECRMPTTAEAAMLGLHASVPVLHIVRTTRTDGDRVVEVLDMVFAGDRYQLEYDLAVHE